MMFSPDAARLRRLCVLMAIAASALVLVTMDHTGPYTSLDSLIDGVRFVAAVAAAICGTIIVIEQRFQRLEAARLEDDDVIDLRDDRSGAQPADGRTPRVPQGPTA